MLEPIQKQGRQWRRSLKALTATVAIAALAACSSQAPPDDAAPAHDNTLTMALGYGGTGVVFDPHAFSDGFNTHWGVMFYEQLGYLNDEGAYENQLAESFTPNEDGTVWTAVLKDGVTFHSGKALTADDVLFTYERIMNPDNGATGFGNTTNIAEVKKIDDLTVEFDLLEPSGIFPEQLVSGFNNGIIPTDFDLEAPVSTGPWELVGPPTGESIEMKRYEGYHGEPTKLDSIRLLGIPDDDARLNALQTGQVDAVLPVRGAQMSTVEQLDGTEILSLPTSAFDIVTMRVDEGPLADQRVRQAIRMAVNREEIVTVVDGGQARIGHDLYGIDDPLYRDDLVRERDVEGAKQLIEEAGAVGMKLTLVSLNTTEGIAQIVAKNANEIGLDVEVEVKDEVSFYTDGYLEYDFGFDQWPGVSILGAAALIDAPGANLNYTHFDDPEYQELYTTAVQTLDDDVRADAVGQMQEILFDRGGLLLPRFRNTVAAVPSNTTGWPEVDPWSFGDVLALKNVEFTS